MQEMTPAQFRSTIADLQDALETERAERAKKARKTAALQEKLNETIKRHNASEIASTFGRIAMSMGAPPDAFPDIINRATKAGWVVGDDGGLELRNPKTGAEERHPLDDRYTPETWYAEQARACRGSNYNPFTGGTPNSGGGGGQNGMMPGKNPWMKDTWDDIAQAAVYRRDPAQAEQLAKAAGSKIGALKPS
jgi:hypothetical protein